MSTIQSLEHHEHAEHISHGAHAEGHAEVHEHNHASFAQWTSLLVAFLAAGLAICEQGSKHAEIRVQQQAIDTADAWAQYQAKSTRATMAKDIAAILTTMDVGSDPAAIKRRDAAAAQMRADQETYERDPKDGKEAISRRARQMGEEREHSLEQTHAYHNGSASYELGIVLATAAAITRSKWLLMIAGGLGIAGIVLSVLGYVAPELGAF